MAEDEPVVFASVPRQPDFVVAAVAPSARYPQSEQRLSVEVQVRNDGASWQGEGDAMLDLVATWDSGPGVGMWAGQTQLSALAAGQPMSVTLELAPPPSLDRPHRLVVTINPTQRVPEPDATDNQLTTVDDYRPTSCRTYPPTGSTSSV